MKHKKEFKIAIVGNPNSGKTTLFNALTGSNQRVGNWPGVTVEKITGSLKLDNIEVEFIDLPGIYSLTSDNIDEKIAKDFIISRDYDAIINIIDSTNLERNLFLTLNLIELKVPIILLINKMDILKKKSIEIDTKKLSENLKLNLISISATSTKDIENLKRRLPDLIKNTEISNIKINYPDEIEKIITEWKEKINDLSIELNVPVRWLILKILEKDSNITEKILKIGALTEEEIANKRNIFGDKPEVIIAKQKFDFINTILKDTLTKHKNAKSFSDQIDKIILNKFLGIPIFLIIMYFMFAVSIGFGGAFIDFFDIFFGAIFVDGLSHILTLLNAPEWLIIFLANGIGSGIQTVSTFIPIMFMMFFVLSFLEDSGYMARAAFVVDRFMRLIGLPGKSFVPMIVGFGCSVPAILSTRTLDSEKDRILTVFITPLMSCSARLPVYALFGAIFFPKNAGFITFSLYMVGIIIAIFSGLLLKKTLFRGEPSYFIMELPPYNPPRIKLILIHTWIRLKSFIKRAGINIIIVVILLGILENIKVGDETILEKTGKFITPVFTPMGIEKDNWPATVALLTGIFAKEVIIGTMNKLYSQPENNEETPFNIEEKLNLALKTIPENLKDISNLFLDPIGIGIIGTEKEKLMEELEIEETSFSSIREKFNNEPLRAYSYLLFVLIYFPCVAAFGAILKEIGTFYGIMSVVYLTIIGWVISTFFFQLTIGKSLSWIIFASLMLIFIWLILYFLGSKKIKSNKGGIS